MNKKVENKNESPEQIQRRVSDVTASAVQRQAGAKNQLKKQGIALKETNRDINTLRANRQSTDNDLNHIKANKSVFKALVFDYCFCCCRCQRLRDWCEGREHLKDRQPVIITTESEEADPDPQTVEKLWTQRYEPKSWYESMDDNLKRLQIEAEECEQELKKQKQLISKIDTKAKSESTKLENSAKLMSDIRDN